MSLPIEKSPHLTNALDRAKKQARMLGHPEVRIEHVFCELLDDPEVFSHLVVEQIDYPELSANALRLVLAINRNSAPNAQNYPPVAEELQTLLATAEDVARAAPRVDIDGPLLLALMQHATGHPVATLLTRHFNAARQGEFHRHYNPEPDKRSSRDDLAPGSDGPLHYDQPQPGAPNGETVATGAASSAPHNQEANSGSDDALGSEATGPTDDPVSDAPDDKMESPEPKSMRPRRRFWEILLRRRS